MAATLTRPAARPPVIAEALSFPSDDELLLSMRGRPVGDHPLSPRAREFGRLHEQLLAHQDQAAEIGCRRRELALEINLWVAERVPVPHPNAPLHTETIGAVIDRMTQAQVRAYDLLMTLDPSDLRVHTAWYRLAELADGYTDLTNEVLNRCRRLPVLGDCW
ncbi:DUF4254 domain-containing protein [Nocardia pseudovaccinii]|uniref:DUF4254 domain-containing protein n=1 Tax=Nocardia pseudovaccinii TaxID=189540 RepID=UPI003D8BA03C